MVKFLNSKMAVVYYGKPHDISWYFTTINRGKQMSKQMYFYDMVNCGELPYGKLSGGKFFRWLNSKIIKLPHIKNTGAPQYENTRGLAIFLRPI